MEIAKNRSGMSIVEVIVAIALVGIIAVGFLSIYVTGAFMERRSGDRTKNVAKAETVAEQALAGAAIVPDLTNGTVAVNGITFQNASVTTTAGITAGITFHGTGTVRNVEVMRIVVDKAEDSINGSEVATEIEIYTPVH